VLLNVIKVAGPRLGAGPGHWRALEAQSTVAFEARIKDTDTGQTVAMFADRQYATLRPIDIKGFTWYGNAEDIVEQWANQFVESPTGGREEHPNLPARFP
jgi:hypothetical protein